MSGSVFLAETEITAEEAAGLARVIIRRSGPLQGEVTLTYLVVGDAATAGADFVGGLGTVTLPAGVASLTLSIPILDDALAEPTESFSVTLVEAVGAALMAPRTTRVAIRDDEAPPPPPPAEPPLVPAATAVFETVVGGLSQPIRFVFDPSDASRLFIAEKRGLVRLHDLDTNRTSVFLDLTAQVNAHGDRGLMGIALHPDFAANPFVYLYYVADPPETAGRVGLDGPDGSGNRYAVVLRVTADPATGAAVPGSEVVLLGTAGRSLADISGGGALDFNLPANLGRTPSDRLMRNDDPDPPRVVAGVKQDYVKVDSTSHAGGHMVFGPDGMLYVATGDGTSYNVPDPRTLEVQNLDTLSGKILRIDPLTGLGLADNPFATEGVDLADNRAKVWQYGLRNPFSFTIGEDGTVIVADVGWTAWEEVNIGGPGANFGWPLFEGGVRSPAYRNMPEAQALYAAIEAGSVLVSRPFAGFAHAASEPGYQMGAIVAAGAVIGGADGRYPEAFRDDLLFADFTNGNLFAMDVGDSGSVRFLGSRPGVIHFANGPDGAVWFANIYSGAVGRVALREASAAQDFAALGTAVAEEGGWRLTAATSGQVGGVASSNRIDLRQDARIVLDAWFGASEAGGQGIGIALHDDPRGQAALAGGGNDLGVAGLVRAVAVEFDTHRNDIWDPVADHGLIYVPGAWGWTGLAGRQELAQLEDGAWHRIEVTWTAATRTFSYLVDGVATDSFDTRVADPFRGGSHAHLLIAAASAANTAEHRIRLVATDVTWEDVAGNQAPVLFGGAARSLAVAENTAGPLLAPRATDAERDTLAWRIAGGADAALFAVDPATGALRFLAPPDFEAPADADADNRYEVTIEVRDPTGAAATQRVTVVVEDVPERLTGTALPDLLLGGDLADTMAGLGGRDTLRAGGGDDLIEASAADGNDSLDGGDGTGDTYSLAALAGRVVLDLDSGLASGGNAGADTLRGIEHVVGGGGNDRLAGDAAPNRLAGGAGDDRLDGRAAADTLRGEEGRDTLLGGAGNDLIEGGTGADSLLGGTESDTLDGGAEGDTLLGEAGLDRLEGGDGDDLLDGGAGVDTLRGGAGADTLRGGTSRDLLEGGAGADRFVFGTPDEAADTILGYAGAEDTLVLLGAGFGLAPGTDLLAAGRYAESAGGAATSPAGFGQITFSTTTFLLRWDANGSAPGGVTLIADLSGAAGWSAGEILIL